MQRKAKIINFVKCHNTALSAFKLGSSDGSMAESCTISSSDLSEEMVRDSAILPSENPSLNAASAVFWLQKVVKINFRVKKMV